MISSPSRFSQRSKPRFASLCCVAACVFARLSASAEDANTLGNPAQPAQRYNQPSADRTEGDSTPQQGEPRDPLPSVDDPFVGAADAEAEPVLYDLALVDEPAPAFAASGVADASSTDLAVLDAWASPDSSLSVPQEGTHSATRLRGWIQQGFTGNPNQPANRSNRPVAFNDLANRYLLNQLYIFFERPVLLDGQAWDWGGRVDLTYGYDSSYLTVPGLERHRDRTKKWNSETEDYGLAMPQLYAELAAPAADGLSIKVGHFYSGAGYESVAAPANLFYSHSYAFAYGTPFTHAGAMATLNTSDILTTYFGYASGWDVWDSLADEWGFFGGATLHTPDRQSSFSILAHAGNDVTNIISGGTPVTDDRSRLRLLFQHALSPTLRYAAEGVYGYQRNTVVDVDLGTFTIDFSDASWYGITQYFTADVAETLSLATRFEWFRDEDGSRLGAPVVFHPGGPALTGANYFAVTAGANWRLWPRAVLRPELRWDWSDVRGNAAPPGGDDALRAFGDRSDGSQITMAVDLVLTY